jgi:hypothetical protein
MSVEESVMANRAVKVGAADLTGQIVETAGTPAPVPPLSDTGRVAFSGLDITDSHAVSIVGFSAGSSNVAASALRRLTAVRNSDITYRTGGISTNSSQAVLLWCRP